MTPFSKNHLLAKIVRGSLMDLPSPTIISGWWNFGSLLGLCLVIQLLSGLFLSMHYISDTSMAFESISHIGRDVNFGWLLRMIHANGASLFFVCLYLHLGRNIYYMSYKFKETWGVGVLLLLLTMATAFLGYVLPWGQMSFWGATVITNLFSALPLIGSDLVSWLWGGFSVNQATLTRFFSLHFMLPFLISGAVGVHLAFLHQHGSNNPLGLSLNQNKVMFYPYFYVKDILGYLIVLSGFGLLVFLGPWVLGDPENFIPANPMVTPVHIQPEWYFLFAYAILRSIPNKLGGVLALALSVMILFICPFMGESNMRGNCFYYLNKSLFWGFVGVVLLLTWIGACPVEHPYVFIGQVLTFLYFSYYFILVMMIKIWDVFLK